MQLERTQGKMAETVIVMATYNGERFLREQIDSILNNTYQDYELHICDDGSTDGTEDIAGEYQKKYPDKIFFHRNEKNLRVIKNFLVNVKKFDGKYYMFCDQDDVWLPYKIQHTIDFLKKTEDGAFDIPAVVFGDAKMVDSELKEYHPSFQKLNNLDTSKLDLCHLAMENKLIGCTVMFNRALWEKLDVFPENIKMHDWWVALVGAAFGKVAFLDEPLLLYRQHGGNQVGGVSEMEYIRQNITKLGEQRQALYDNCRQAKAFVDVYRDSLSPEQVRLMDLFGDVPNQGWFKRRYQVFHNGFTKTGFVRNFGTFVIL
ncbi:MAG: glycosyltransferase family 2 protein [Pararoseburia sp.]|nr:glycosyltransferase family 2 protein [Pararoseburia sp.]